MNYVYDLEIYPNVFTASFQCIETGDRWYYEISERRNDLSALTTFLFALRDSRATMVGYNNFAFDWPICNFILERYVPWLNLTDAAVTAFIYEFMQSIFAASKEQKFDMILWRPIIRQIDLYKIHHFDNFARATSLKMLEFNMRSTNIKDLPYPPGTPLTVDQIPVLASYNMHDVAETVKFYHESLKYIKFRESLTGKYDKDFTNFSDVKIGKELFIMHLEKANPNACFYKDANGDRQPHQTLRPTINLADVVFPYVKFNHPEFQRIHNYFLSQTITQTKGTFEGLECTVNGFKYVFGLGGIHGSVNNKAVHACDKYEILDIDVTGFYPSVAIVNRVFPAHLGETYCDISKSIFDERATYPKTAPESQALKLALNATYGNSNNKHSPFYDPFYTMTITINGQLLLCMLAESLQHIPELEMIQINTDGLTIKIPRTMRAQVDDLCKSWENMSRLELESVNYESMFVRDVNSYIGVFEDGTTKQIGAFETKHPRDRKPIGWHQNLSAMIVPKAASAALVEGVDLVEYITSPERDIMDFMLRTKIDRSSRLVVVDDLGGEIDQQRISRYYVAHTGGSLMKLSPPTVPHTEGTFKKASGVTDAEYFSHDPKVWREGIHTKNRSVYATRTMGIDVGWKVEICNDISHVNGLNINHAYYITEAKKLIERIK
jgi:hypothetical protein